MGKLSSQIITNITDKKQLEKIGRYFKKDIITVSSEPPKENKTFLNIKNYQLTDNYEDSIKIMNRIFQENNIKEAIINSNLFGTYLYAFISGFNKLPLICICKNGKIEPIIINPTMLSETKIKILEYINKNPGSKTSEIFKGVGITAGSSQGYRQINSLKFLKLIEENESGYEVTEFGKIYLKQQI